MACNRGALSSFFFAILVSSLVINRDRLVIVQHRVGSEQLRNGFTGRVIDASSSVPEDKERIMLEISSNESPQIVDAAIDVLLSSGMSTPDLCLLHSHGCNTACASMPRFSLYALFCTVNCLTLPILVGCHVSHAAMVMWLAVFFALGLSLVSSKPDSHVFQTRAFTKVLIVEFLLMMVVDNALLLLGTRVVGVGACLASDHHYSVIGYIYLEMEIWLILLLRAACLVVIIAGPTRTLYMPWLGPCIVRFILGKAGRPEADHHGGAGPCLPRIFPCFPGFSSHGDFAGHEQLMTGHEQSEDWI